MFKTYIFKCLSSEKKDEHVDGMEQDKGIVLQARLLTWGYCI